MMEQESARRRLFTAIDQHPVAAFLAITFAWGWMFYVAAAFVIAGHPERTWLLVFFQTPGAAAALLAGHVVRYAHGGKASVERGWRRYARWRLPVWIYAVAIGALPALAGLAALISGRLGAGFLDMWGNVGPFAVLFVATSIVGQLASSPLLEEYGWRGFLQPSLQERHRALPSALFIGTLWGLHHVPLAIAFGLPVWETVFGTLGPSILAAWLLNAGGGSMVGPMFLHSSLNVSIQVIAPDGPLFDVLALLFAAGVVLVVGPVNLARRPRFTLTAEERPPTTLPGSSSTS